MPTYFGNDSNEVITGYNNVFAGGGADTIFGLALDEPGTEILDGQDGNDQITGSAISERLVGGNGNDGLKGGAGDTLLGGAGRDTLAGGFSGSTTLDGGNGKDELFAYSEGRDYLFGGGGNDTLFSLTLAGEVAEDDVYTGGSGNDIFSDNKGAVIIVTDFSSGEDQLAFNYTLGQTLNYTQIFSEREGVFGLLVTGTITEGGIWVATSSFFLNGIGTLISDLDILG
jgi:hypothetical protein